MFYLCNVIVCDYLYVPKVVLSSRNDGIVNKQYTFFHSIATCRKRWFLFVLKILFHSSLCTLSCHPSPRTIRLSSLTSSCHLFLGLPLNRVSIFIYNTFWEFFSSIICTYPNQSNNLIGSYFGLAGDLELVEETFTSSENRSTIVQSGL